MRIFSKKINPLTKAKTISLGEKFEVVLSSLDRMESQPGIDGEMHKIPEAHRKTRISRQAGELIYQLYLEQKPDLSLEIGLAFGHSTIYILSAIHALNAGHHLAMDPYQKRLGGVGAYHGKRLGMEDHFDWIDEFSERALPVLATQGKRVQFVFIDGGHLFDNVFVDFFLSSQILDHDGIVIFDDFWMKSVKRVVRFIEANRHDFKRLNCDVAGLAIFRKVGSDDRNWDHYRSF